MRKKWEQTRALWARIGPRAHDVAFILIALTFSVAGFFFPGPSGGPVIRPLGLVIGLVGALALWWRRPHPVRTVLIGLVTAVLAFNPAVVVIGLLTLTIRRRDVTLAVLAVASWLVLGIIPNDRRGFAVDGPTLVGSAVWVAFALLAGAYVGTRRDLLTSLRDRATRAEAERELRAEQARLAERARIAREMHDVLAHKVSLIALHAGGLEVNPGSGPDRVAESAGLIRVTARQALEDLRGVLGALRSDQTSDGVDLAPQPSLDDLPRLVDASRAAGVQVTLDVALTRPDVPQTVGRAAYRVVQESLTNVHKHARGAATAIGLTESPTALVVEVRNERPVAVGTLLPGSEAGLIGLRERVQLLGGELSSGPQPDGGWKVAATIPWGPDVEAA